MRGTLGTSSHRTITRSLGARATPSSGLGHGYHIAGLLRPRRRKTISSEPELGKTQIMRKSITVKPKRGRPATGRDPFVGIRLPELLLKQIQLWSVEHRADSRSKAIRSLVELGLKAKGK